MTTPAVVRWSRPGLVALASVTLLLVCAALRCIWESDYWWQLATGRLIARSGIPHADPFSWVAPGRPWIELRWGYDLLLYQVVTWFGPGGAVGMKVVLLLAAFGLAAAPVVTRRNGVLVAAVALLALLASQQRFFVRPELFTYLFLALQLALLERDRRAEDRLLFLLPVLSLAWVNLHTLAILGPIVTALAAASRARSRRFPLLLGVAALQLAAGLANPYGLEGFVHPFQLFGEIRGTLFKTTISEFESPWRMTTAFAAVGAYKVLTALTLLAVLVRPKSVDPFRALVTLALFYLSTLAVRNIPLFALAAIPFLVGQLGGLAWLRGPGARRRAEAGAAALLSLLAVGLSWSLVTNRFYAATNDSNRFGAGIAPHRYPVRVTERLRVLGLSGGVFNTMHEGSYLVAHGERVFIDPRLEVQGEAHVARYLRMLRDPAAWADESRRLGIQAALVDIEQLPFLQARLAEGWRLDDWDATAALLVAPGVTPSGETPPSRSLDADAARLRADLPRPTPLHDLGVLASAAATAPYQRVANVFVRFGRLDLARPFLEDAVSAGPANSPARLTLAQVCEALGDPSAARREFAEAVRRAPRLRTARELYGRFLVTHGERDAGRVLLEQVCLEENSTDPLAWAILGSAWAAGRDYARAVQALERAAALDPANETIRGNLEKVRAARASQ